jgi:hypothetical protein
VINTATNTVNETVTVGPSPYGIAITPNGEYVYVTNLATVKTQSPAADWIGTVSVISTATNTVLTASSSPAVPEFPAQSLTITLLVSAIIILSAVIIAQKKAGKTNPTSTQHMLALSDGKISEENQAPAETRLANRAK